MNVINDREREPDEPLGVVLSGVGRWTAIPEDLLYDPENISDKAVRVFGCLYRHGVTPRSCYPGHKRIAGLVGGSWRSVPRWLDELYRSGWVQPFARYGENGGQLTNGYRLVSTVDEAKWFGLQFAKGVRFNSAGEAETAYLKARSTPWASERGEDPYAYERGGGTRGSAKGVRVGAYQKRASEREQGKERKPLPSDKSPGLGERTPLAGTAHADVEPQAPPAQLDLGFGASEPRARDEVEAGSAPSEPSGAAHARDDRAKGGNEAGEGSGRTRSAPRTRAASKPKTVGPNSARAREIATHVWENRNPRPAGKFIALAKVLEALLDANHKPEHVQAAAMRARAITIRAMEFELNGGPKQSSTKRNFDDTMRDFFADDSQPPPSAPQFPQPTIDVNEVAR